jgi:hypothetical protein
MSPLGDDLSQLRKSSPSTQRGSYIYLLVGEEARAKAAIGSEAQAVAPLAEAFAKGSDETDGPLGSGKAVITSWPSSQVNLGRLQAPQMALDLLSYLPHR